MGRPKGGSNRKWTDEERLKYVHLYEERHMPLAEFAREMEIPKGTLVTWISRYREGGVAALNPEKLRRGNRFAALHASKSLSETDRLRLMVEKLEVENERLKKGYIMKGVGASKEFVTSSDWSFKSLKR